MTTPNTQGAADLLTLIEAYAEARHKQGHSSYNAQSAAALQAVKDALSAAQQPAPSPAPAEWLEQAFREGWAACRDSEFVGEEAEEWSFGSSQANGRMIDIQQAAPTAQADTQPAPVLPESLTLAVDRWFSENTGLGGCSDKDVSELGELFYGVKHAGGRESVEDALAIVESFGQGIGGLNDTYARQILLAEEVKRLRAARTPENSQPAPVLDEAFDCARAALNHCLDRASIAHILDTLRTRVDKAVLVAARAPADSVPPPAEATNTKTHELLSTTVGLLMGYREGAARQPYKPGSVIAKVVYEVVDHLKDWPYLEPIPPAQTADSVLEDAAPMRNSANRYCHAGMCLETDEKHEPDCPQGHAARKQGAKHD